MESPDLIFAPLLRHHGSVQRVERGFAFLAFDYNEIMLQKSVQSVDGMKNIAYFITYRIFAIIVFIK